MIAFVHGDLHPRNILVAGSTDGGVYLSGIIDREASGFYHKSPVPSER